MTRPHRPITLMLIALALLVPTTPLAVAQPLGVVAGVDVARVPGVVEAIGRSFDSLDADATSGLGHVEFAVFAFADSQAAETAMSEIYPALTRVLRDQAQPAEPPALGDAALAWTAAGPESLAVATLLVQDAAVVHLFTGVADGDAPLDALVEIAGETVGRVPEGTPSASPVVPGTTGDPSNLTSGGLWNLLPTYDDLPGAFGLYTEEAWPEEEPAGVPPAPDPADCDIAPRTADEIRALVPATPAADAPAEATPIAVASPAAGDAAAPAVDQETVDGVTAAARGYLACMAVGDWLRTYAHVTDRLLAEQIALFGPEFADFLLSEDAGGVPVAEGQRLVAVRDVQVLPDGRVGAMAETVNVSSGRVEPSPVTFIWFVEEDGRFLIDGFADIAGEAPATPTGG